MIAVLINIVLILIGGSIGLFFKGNKKVERYVTRITAILSVMILAFGIQSIVKFDNTFIVMGSLVFGTIIGEVIDIDSQIQKFANWLQRGNSDSGDFSKGFVDATLIYCIGSMAIIGSLQSGINGNHTIIIAKSVMDGLVSIVLASKYGKGVLLSAASVGIYQGILTLSAMKIQYFLTDSIITQMTNVGGILLIALALNLLEITKFKLANYLPALFIPILLGLILSISA